MSESNFNYLIKEQNGVVSSRELVAKIASFFVSFGEKICIITKFKLTTEEASRLFGALSENERRLITFMYCKNYNVVLDKLLEIDSTLTVPKVLIIESLHQWYNHTTEIEKLPAIFSTIIAAAQDLVNVCSRILQQSCFSFILSSLDELPTSLVEMYYDSSIEAEENCLSEVLFQHR